MQKTQRTKLVSKLPLVATPFMLCLEMTYPFVPLFRRTDPKATGPKKAKQPPEINDKTTKTTQAGKGPNRKKEAM